MASVVKLECFTSAEDQTRAAIYTRDDLDMAYADGMTAGRAERQNEELQALYSGLERMVVALGAEDARRATLRDEAVQALAPILTAILDATTPAANSRRMEEALQQELQSLAGRAGPLRCRISCSPALKDMVERHLRQLGMDGVELEIREQECISLALEGGRIELSATRLAEDIRRLIDEINGDDEKWTH